MTRRTRPDGVASLEDLTDLDVLVVDKRQDKRARAKRLRRDRHYQRALLRQGVRLDAEDR